MQVLAGTNAGTWVRGHVRVCHCGGRGFCCSLPQSGQGQGKSGGTQNEHISETGRIRFRGVRFQTPNSASVLGLTEFRGANSVSSFWPIICV